MRPALPFLAVGVLVAGLACNALTNDSVLREMQPAIIRYDPVGPIVFTVPETVAVATNFEVAIHTYGNGCVTPGSTQTFITGALADVVPFDIFVVRSGPGFACTDELRTFIHRAILQFDATGNAMVRVRGRVRPGDSVAVRELPVYVR